MNTNDYPLKDIVVLEVAQAVAGPFIGTLMADLGANVIHIERPKVGDLARHWIPKRKDLSFYFGVVNRNKRSLTLDLRSEKGRELFYEMAKKADVIIENFRPGVVNKLKIDYQTITQMNPGIIYCHISGFGQSGPYKDRAAFDQVMQGETGIISYTGTPDTPCKINVPMTDYVAALFGTYAVLSSLYRREKTGKGMEVDVSLFDSAVSMMLNLMNMSVVEGLKDSELRMGAKYHLATPYEPYMAGDGRYVNICVAMETHWQAFCKAIGLEELLSDPRFAKNENRLKHREELEEILVKKLKEKSRDEWIEIFNEAGVPCGAVNTIPEVLEHPQLKHRKTVVDVEYPGLGKIKLFNNPVKFSEFDIEVKRPPRLGEHTEEVLKEFGYSSDEIESLKKEGII